jgi:hypothetical protein
MLYSVELRAHVYFFADHLSAASLPVQGLTNDGIQLNMERLSFQDHRQFTSSADNKPVQMAVQMLSVAFFWTANVKNKFTVQNKSIWPCHQKT